MDTTLTVNVAGGHYPIIVAAGALGELPAQLNQLGLRGRLWLISDASVYPHYGHGLEASLGENGWSVQSHTVPSGEASKDLAIVAQLYDWMISGHVERRDTVLALGGGVVGDLAGFVAATVLRGIGLVHLPTTLLAMVDSSIGGKTGVNHQLGKNLIGAFHQPRLVLADTTTLTTLPARELQAGWAEAIKHGVIRDAGLFEHLEANTTHDLRSEALAALIRRAVRVKVDVVNADERETGERMLLNYGHTLGHAVEAAAGYGTLLHGEAIAIGMHLEAQLARASGMVEQQMVERQADLLRAYGLPITIPAELASDQILALTLRDKKVQAGNIRWALPTGIGSATVRSDIPSTLVEAVVAANRVSA